MVCQQKTCQEQTHLPNCDPFTIVKHLDGVLRLPWNSLILHLIDITRKGIKVNLENRWITKRKQTRTVAFSDL